MGQPSSGAAPVPTTAPNTSLRTRAEVTEIPGSYLAALTGCERGEEAEARESRAQSDALPDPSPRASQRHLLWSRDGSGPDGSIHSAPGPGIGEGGMSTVHFIIHSGRLFGKSLKKWLVTSIDTDSGSLYFWRCSPGVSSRMAQAPC
ncbi:unnamed protein product [Sphacelaria rigidula]